MSIEDRACRPLGDYISDLMEMLESDHPSHFQRLREVVGDRSAQIDLDGESVVVWFTDGFRVDEPGAKDVDGMGATDTATVIDVLDGLLEVSDAIASGRLTVVGAPDGVHRMFVAIEILLDAAARSPRLREVAAAFRSDPCHQHPSAATRQQPAQLHHPATPSEAELELLGVMGLLPEH